MFTVVPAGKTRQPGCCNFRHFGDATFSKKGLQLSPKRACKKQLAQKCAAVHIPEK